MGESVDELENIFFKLLLKEGKDEISLLLLQNWNKPRGIWDYKQTTHQF